MKLTEWYPYSTKPVREGVYETNMSGRLGYSYWTGKQWSNQSLHAVYAERSKAWISGASQKKNWRGLAEPPAAPPAPSAEPKPALAERMAAQACADAIRWDLDALRALEPPPAAPPGEEEVTRLVRWLTAPIGKGAK